MVEGEVAETKLLLAWRSARHAAGVMKVAEGILEVGEVWMEVTGVVEGNDPL